MNTIKPNRVGHQPWHIRRAESFDRSLIRNFLARIGPPDQRFRFLNASGEAGRNRVIETPDVDHDKRDHFLVFADQKMIAIGALACDPALQFGEAAIVVSPGHQKKDISWKLLCHIAKEAAAKGVRTLTTIAHKADHGLHSIARKRGFTINDYPGEPNLAIVRARTRAQ